MLVIIPVKINKFDLMKRFLFLLLSIFCYSCTQKDDNWSILFNGEDLSGWHIYGGSENLNGWYVDNGVLVFDPALRTTAETANLITDQVYTNFELSMDWMISENGNSGLFWGVLEDEKFEHPYQTGPEIQILDDDWDAYINERGNIQRAGSIFNVLAPSKIVSKPSGEWNSFLLRINHLNNEGSLDFNGERILEFPVNGKSWQEMINQSGFKDWEGFGVQKEGRICLQDHGSKVAFRRIKVRELIN